MRLFDKKGQGMTESQVKLQDNLNRIQVIEDELEGIPDQLSQLEKDLAKANTFERSPIFKLKDHRDTIFSERGQLQRANNELERVIQWETQIAEAPGILKAVLKKIVAAEKDLAKHQVARDKLAAKLSSLKDAAAVAQVKAGDAEQAAAKAYAAAMAAGDEAAEATALAKLEKASEEVRAMASRASSAVTAALETELSSLDAAVEAATEVLVELEGEQIKAARARLGAEWDAAATALIEVGAKLYAAGAITGSTHGFFDSLHIPLTAKTGRCLINARCIERGAEPITREVLITS